MVDAFGRGGGGMYSSLELGTDGIIGQNNSFSYVVRDKKDEKSGQSGI